MKLHLFNSLSRKYEEFVPICTLHVRMYVCGPTVYDRPHIGNARSAVVYDTIYRILKHLYPKVTYVRNITDVDDKIIEAANTNNEDITSLTQRVTEYYHEDIGSLNCLAPDIEPKATEHIADMIEMIAVLIKKGYAYIAKNHVFFDTTSFKKYGHLSHRLDQKMITGTRAKIVDFKRNTADFVLWKPEQDRRYGFDSLWGLGRPGWHIECSAMSKKYLGDSFDIHGGGADLMFPHHENEIAQSCCANDIRLANYWVHNGFLTVNGEKMSKSLNNFKTVKELIDSGTSAMAIRYLYMTTHYRKPLNFSDKAIADATKSVNNFAAIYSKYHNYDIFECTEIINALLDDINTAKILAILHRLIIQINKEEDKNLIGKFIFGCNILGLNLLQSTINNVIPEEVIAIAEQRMQAKNNQNWQLADDLRQQIQKRGYIVRDNKDGYQIIACQ